MGKVIKSVAIGAALVGAAFLTGGASIIPSLSVTAAGATTIAAGYLSTTALGSVLIGMGVSTALGGVMQGLQKAPKASLAQLGRLNASVDPSTPRKMALGRTALAVDIRYVEPSGTDQEYVDYIIACAAHKVSSIEEIWLEDTKAWSSGSGVTTKYNGYLTVSTRLEGTAANTISINGGSKWGTSRRLTGCAYIHLRIKRTGNGKKAESPFAGGLASRMTVIGNGMPVYDPRFDSTVPGGFGPMRVNDQTTWAFTYSGIDCGNNTAVQLLNYMLGWRINGKLSVGRGIPAARLDLPSFITAANLCDEVITKADLSTEPRYRTAGLYSESDDPSAALASLTTSMNANLRDYGQLSLDVAHNDLAAYVLDLNENDVLGAFSWDQTPALHQTFNVVRGKYTNSAPDSLYQTPDYPEISIASPDGIDRVFPLDLLNVESASRAQRIAKQVLQRQQYQGTFSATFQATAWGCRVGQVVRFSFAPLGWSNKLFRVTAQQIAFDGTCPMTLREEHEDIYAWDKEDVDGVEPVAPTIYDPLNAPLIKGIGEAVRMIDLADLIAAAVAYDPSHTYAKGELAVDQGSIWIYSNVTPGSGHAPPTLPTTGNGYWELFAAKGEDGSSTYMWIAYADSADGTVNFTTGAPLGRDYIGIAYNKDSIVESNNAADYEWAPFVGPPGPPGSPGAPGSPGSPGAPGRDAVVFHQDTTPSAPVVGDTWATLSLPKIWRKWNGTAWVRLLGDVAAYDAIGASQIAVSQLSAITATIGTLRTAASGARTEIKDNVVEVYDASNVRRVRMGVW